MTTEPFEDPAKTEMRARCEIAIDQSGYDLVDPPSRVEPPENSALHGALKGDLQSADGEGNRHCYYLRPTTGDTLPKWLGNLARVAHHVGGVRFYVVVSTQVAPSFERSCRTAGAGVLLLTEDNEFEHIINFDDAIPDDLSQEFAHRTDDLRRSMEAKLELNLSDLRSKFERIGELTMNMPDRTADKYRQGVEAQFRIWTEWGDGLSELLDAAVATPSKSDLDTIEALIIEGPDLDELGEEVDEPENDAAQ